MNLETEPLIRTSESESYYTTSHNIRGIDKSIFAEGDYQMSIPSSEIVDQYINKNGRDQKNSPNLDSNKGKPILNLEYNDTYLSKNYSDNVNIRANRASMHSHNSLLSAGSGSSLEALRHTGSEYEGDKDELDDIQDTYNSSLPNSVSFGKDKRSYVFKIKSQGQLIKKTFGIAEYNPTGVNTQFNQPQSDINNNYPPLLIDPVDHACGEDLTPNNKPLNNFPPNQKDPIKDINKPEYLPEFHSDVYFDVILDDINKALELGIHPERIAQGSSGSYFIRNSNRKIVAVFKPKDEEPYGSLNPKWTKFLHRNLCPCTFGRSCLIPNQGYLSEVGASIIDSMLGLSIVPKTKIVKFSSPSFHVHWYDRWFGDSYPEKKGSLQLFVHGFKDAYTVIKELIQDVEQANGDPELNMNQNSLTFQFEFEKLVCLDYITRNTDRGNDNWLIKYYREIPSSLENNNDLHEKGPVRLAAIDNGLSFPFKHPNHWRTYPYYWAWLPCAKIKFSDKIADMLYAKLNDQLFVEQLIKELYTTFKTDGAFNEAMFSEQASVIRGQILNLCRALESRMTPIELLQIPVMTVIKDSDFKQQFSSPAWFTCC